MQQAKSNACGQKVRSRPGKRNKHLIPVRIAQVSRIDGHGLRPADEREMSEKLQQWKQNGPDRIDMRYGIERYSP